MKNNKITFWGTRGSFPTPDLDKVKVGGDTSCVSLETGNQILILDMGTGARNLGQYIINNPNSSKIINIFLSHYHWDHMLGFLMFAPLFSEEYEINIYGKKDRLELKDILNHMLDPIFWPASSDFFKAKLNYCIIDDNVNLSKNLTVNSQIHHHPNGAYSYNVSFEDKKITYITDCEYTSGSVSQKLIDFAKSSDLLIHDSHFSKEDLPRHKGWGHSSWNQAVDIAKKSNSKQLALFHHNPNYSDHDIQNIENKAQSEFESVFVAKQGLFIYL